MIIDSDEKRKELEITMVKSSMTRFKVGIIISLILTAIFVFLAYCAWSLLNDQLSVFCVILACVFCVIFAVCIMRFRMRKRTLELIQTDFARYQDRKEKDKEEKEKSAEAAREEIRKRNAEDPQPKQVSTLRCPVCNSTKTKRISTTQRAASVFLVGLASDKIGKQYECLNCRHKW